MGLYTVQEAKVKHFIRARIGKHQLRVKAGSGYLRMSETSSCRVSHLFQRGDRIGFCDSVSL